MKNIMKENKGITLIALVVTIVVLVVLATVSINLVFSKNGIISKAEGAGKFQTNAIASDRDAMDGYKQHITNAVASRGGNTYTCPYCGEGHNTFEGGAVKLREMWWPLYNCSCGYCVATSTCVENDNSGTCPKCSDSVGVYDYHQDGYETSCCGVNFGYDLPDDSDWRQ